MSVDDGFVVYGLYCICIRCQGKPNPIRYVGQTRRSVGERLNEHLKNSRRDKNHRIGGLPVYRWVRKHGEGNIRLKVLATGLDDATVDAAEVHQIAVLGTRAPDGLNMTDGGMGKSGYRHSEQTKKAISEKKRGVPGFSKSGLTVHQVEEIKLRLWEGETQAYLADEFQVSRKTLKDISQGKTWNHVPWPIGPRRRMRSSELRSRIIRSRKRDSSGRLV